MFNTQCSDRNGNIAISFLACSSAVRDITEAVNQLHHDIFFSLQVFGIKNILETPDRKGKSFHLVSNAFSCLFNRGTQIALNAKNIRSNVTEFTLFGRHSDDKLILISRIRSVLELDNLIDHKTQFICTHDIVCEAICISERADSILLQYKCQNENRQIARHKAIRLIHQYRINLANRDATILLKFVSNDLLYFNLYLGNQEIRFIHPIIRMLPSVFTNKVFQLCVRVRGAENALFRRIFSNSCFNAKLHCI